METLVVPSWESAGRGAKPFNSPICRIAVPTGVALPTTTLVLFRTGWFTLPSRISVPSFTVVLPENVLEVFG